MNNKRYICWLCIDHINDEQTCSSQQMDRHKRDYSDHNDQPGHGFVCECSGYKEDWIKKLKYGKAPLEAPDIEV